MTHWEVVHNLVAILNFVINTIVGIFYVQKVKILLYGRFKDYLINCKCYV